MIEKQRSKRSNRIKVFEKRGANTARRGLVCLHGVNARFPQLAFYSGTHSDPKAKHKLPEGHR